MRQSAESRDQRAEIREQRADLRVGDRPQTDILDPRPCLQHGLPVRLELPALHPLPRPQVQSLHSLALPGEVEGVPTQAVADLGVHLQEHVDGLLHLAHGEADDVGVQVTLDVRGIDIERVGLVVFGHLLVPVSALPLLESIDHRCRKIREAI